MKMTWFGNAAHFSGGEGAILRDLGLLSVREEKYECEITATHTLMAMFRTKPWMEEIYEPLVELILARRYRHQIGFTDEAQVDRKLRSLGMTDDGLTRLKISIAGRIR